jgi:transcriptional regulator
MYRPPAFAIDDAGTLHAFIRAQPFAVVALAVGEGVQLAYAPVILSADGGSARFHLTANNPVGQAADGARVTLSFLGAHAYISPDWYETAGMVPTWNYEAVEGRGMVRKLDPDALRALLDALSQAEEVRLAPKPVWTADKVPAEKMARLLAAITGFEIVFESLQGKFKLSQNLAPQDFGGALRGLDMRGDPASSGVAAAMRKAQKPG